MDCSASVRFATYSRLLLALVCWQLIGCRIQKATTQSALLALVADTTQVVTPCVVDEKAFVRQAVKLTGYAAKRDDLGGYVIVYGVPNTIDTEWVGIVKNLDSLNKYEGKAVAFSGNYYQAPGKQMIYGGESIYYLCLTSFRALPDK